MSYFKYLLKILFQYLFQYFIFIYFLKIYLFSKVSKIKEMSRQNKKVIIKAIIFEYNILKTKQKEIPKRR